MERIDDLGINNLKIIQNTDGFRFGIDSVLLTEFARDIKKGSKIADFGSGTGILGILLTAKVNPSEVILFEKQKEVAEMSKKSVELNHLEKLVSVENVDIGEIKNRNSYFDAVITNPPYKKQGTGIDSKTEKHHISRFETSCSLHDWILKTSKVLKSKGALYIVYRADRLQELANELKQAKLEIKRMRFVYSNINTQSNLVLIKAVRGAGEFLKVEKPLIIYNEDGSYTDEIKEIYKEK